MNPEKVVSTGLIGNFVGWRIGGKTYDNEGNEIKEAHEQDCYCCRPNLLSLEPLKKEI